jgi:hypothetical protein
MPDRVKCLHVLIAHSLAKGPGVNPLGDEAVGDPGRPGSPAAAAALVPAQSGSDVAAEDAG